MDRAIPTFHPLLDPFIITSISRGARQWGGNAIHALLTVEHQQFFNDFLFNILSEKTTKNQCSLLAKRQSHPPVAQEKAQSAVYRAWVSHLIIERNWLWMTAEKCIVCLLWSWPVQYWYCKMSFLPCHNVLNKVNHLSTQLEHLLLFLSVAALAYKKNLEAVMAF